MAHNCRHLLVFKHKKENAGNSYHCLLHCNTTIEEGDDTLPSSFFLLKHREEGDNNLLSSSSSQT
jgi:hypothetical protein